MSDWSCIFFSRSFCLGSIKGHSFQPLSAVTGVTVTVTRAFLMDATFLQPLLSFFPKSLKLLESVAMADLFR